ncbi:hypothetical protein ACNKHU_01160 [Shigella flexneri]
MKFDLPWSAYAHHHQLGAGDDQQAAGEDGKPPLDIAAIPLDDKKASTCCNARKSLRYSALNRAA